jgi:hypothetical protein
VEETGGALRERRAGEIREARVVGIDWGSHRMNAELAEFAEDIFLCVLCGLCG